VGDFRGKDIADIGCGYQAAFSRTILDRAKSVTLADVSISNDLKADKRIRVIEGALHQSLSLLDDRCLDLVICISVLEHLYAPEKAISEFHRVLRPDGLALLNVPSWRGKRFLEFSAFRLGTSPADEMDDHKMYYDVPDLWPLLVKAGFPPSGIRCFRHKFGMNTFAVCRKRKG
jgi:SAM-dependent methyltransferase